jgi:hypothetical protein
MSTQIDDIDNIAQSIFIIFLFIFMLSDTTFYVNKIVKDKRIIKKYDYLKNSIYVIYQYIFNKYEKDDNNGALILDSYMDNNVTNIKYYKIEHKEESEDDDEEDEVEEDDDEEDEVEEDDDEEDEVEENDDEEVEEEEADDTN